MRLRCGCHFPIIGERGAKIQLCRSRAAMERAPSAAVVDEQGPGVHSVAFSVAHDFINASAPAFATTPSCLRRTAAAADGPHDLPSAIKRKPPSTGMAPAA